MVSAIPLSVHPPPHNFSLLLTVLLIGTYIPVVTFLLISFQRYISKEVTILSFF